MCYLCDAMTNAKGHGRNALGYKTPQNVHQIELKSSSILWELIVDT